MITDNLREKFTDEEIQFIFDGIGAESGINYLIGLLEKKDYNLQYDNLFKALLPKLKALTCQEKMLIQHEAKRRINELNLISFPEDNVD